MRFSFLLLLGLMVVSPTCFAAEKIITDDNKVDLNITIYNQNLALVRDERAASFDKGVNNIAFEGVAAQIRPETAVFSSDGIRVLEQNYDYAVLTYTNMVEKSVGKTVKTVRTNQTTGENIFESGKILSSTFGIPVLEFEYGVDANYPGRVIFDGIPEGLRKKPTLVAKIYNDTAVSKNLSLVYLTSGVNWITNYVAKVIDDTKLNITGWVTINNESGIDYNDVRIQLVAGNVNQVSAIMNTRTVRPMMAVASFGREADAAGSVVPEVLSGFQLYTLPARTDLKDKQTKQISMIERSNVIYKRVAELASQLNLQHGIGGEFRQLHPNITYVINNKEEDNLGIPLPAGTMRFFEGDADNNMQFTGENAINHTAKGEELRINLGTFFDIFVNGRVISVDKKSERKNILENRCYNDYVTHVYTVEITFNNSGKYNQEVKFTQHIPSNARIVSESAKSARPNSGMLEWVITVQSNGKVVLNYVVEVESRTGSRCN